MKIKIIKNKRIKIKKITKFFIIFILTFNWLLVGWPPVWLNPRIPPKINSAMAQDGDFEILRGTTILSSGQTTATITEGVDYTLESGVTINDAFIRITNTRLTGIGRTASGGSQNQDDFSVRIDNPENLLTSIDFRRYGTTNNCRVTWEIIQYIGDDSGANEIIVRGVNDVATSGTTATVDGTTLSNINDIDKVAVFITGQAGVNANRADWWEHLFTAEMVADASNWIPRFSRGKSGSNIGYVSYAVVEFTGSNWRDVQRLEITTETTAWTTSNYSTAYTDRNFTDEGGVNLLDASKAFLHIQYRTDNDSTGLDDAGDNIEIISTSQLRIRNSANTNNRWKVVWIIENTQTSTGAMSVEHVMFYNGTISGTEENSWTQSINSVSSMTETSIMGECASMDGTGTAYPRGAIDVRLTATNQVTLTESDIGQERVVTFDVVQWPTAPAAVSISLDTDGVVAFGDLPLNSTQDTTVSGINDVETIRVDSGPADLDVRSTAFTEGGNTWTLNTSNGNNQVKWDFSNNGTEWTTFAVVDTLYTLATNVATDNTANLYLKLTMPTDTISYNQYSSTVTIVASAP